MLEVALNNGYWFRAFDDPRFFDATKVCLLRHDIDADLGAALKIAQIEAQLEIRSTYFVMLRSPVYNLLARANICLLQEILALGHGLGLHYDEGFCSDNRYTTEDWVYFEREMLEKVTGSPIRVVSFHQPNEHILKGNIKLRKLINTYNKEDMMGFEYVSDSNMQWRDETPLEIFQNKIYDKLHLLIHPMWWKDGKSVSTEDCWDHAIKANWERSQQQLLETERAFGNKRRITLERKHD